MAVLFTVSIRDARGEKDVTSIPTYFLERALSAAGAFTASCESRLPVLSLGRPFVYPRLVSRI